MVAERRCDSEGSLAMDSPRGTVGGQPTRRQPSLAEEIEEVERERRVTRALQAKVEPQHGMTQKSPKGHTPQTPGDAGVTNTPKRTPKKVKTPSPVRTDADGRQWTLEDDYSEEENEEEEEEK